MFVNIYTLFQSLKCKNIVFKQRKQQKLFLFCMCFSPLLLLFSFTLFTLYRCEKNIKCVMLLYKNIHILYFFIMFIMTIAESVVLVCRISIRIHFVRMCVFFSYQIEKHYVTKFQEGCVCVCNNKMHALCSQSSTLNLSQVINKYSYTPRDVPM